MAIINDKILPVLVTGVLIIGKEEEFFKYYGVTIDKYIRIIYIIEFIFWYIFWGLY